MPAKNVDIVFCIDASDSMAPCLDAVRKNINVLLKELESVQFNWRLGLVIHSVAKSHSGGSAIRSTGINGIELRNALYAHKTDKVFTDDVGVFQRTLEATETEGDEAMLIALDFALDFPFGPIQNTQRVIVMLSDEPFETNDPDIQKSDYNNEIVEKLLQKITARKVMLLAVMPVGNIAEKLSEADKSEIIPVEKEQSVGLGDIDLRELFMQFGKSISSGTASLTSESPYSSALFKQDQWGTVSDAYNQGDVAH